MDTAAAASLFYRRLLFLEALLGAFIPVFLGAPRCFLRLDAELNPPQLLPAAPGARAVSQMCP